MRSGTEAIFIDAAQMFGKFNQPPPSYFFRQLSGAQIKISNCEQGTNDRKVTITGFPDTLGAATYLINTR